MFRGVAELSNHTFTKFINSRFRYLPSKAQAQTLALIIAVTHTVDISLHMKGLSTV